MAIFKTGVLINGDATGGVRAFAEARQASARFGRAVDTLKSQVTGLVGVISAGLIARTTISNIAAFEESIAGVRAVTGASVRDISRMSEVARELGASTRFSASEAAEGMRFLGMAGFDTRSIIESMPAVLNLATAATLDLGSAADITSNIMSAFGIEAARSTEIADALAVAASSANTDVRQMGDAMKYVGPVAAALGISMQDTAAAVGALSNAGIQGTSAGTGLRRILSELASPSKQAAEALAQFGVSADQVNPKTRSLIEIITTLRDRGISAEQAFTIFGDRGAPAILALTTLVPDLERLTGRINDAGGAAAAMAQTMGDTLRGDMLNLKSALEEVTLQLGDSGLTGAMRSTIQEATGFIRFISGSGEEAERARQALAGLGIAVGSLAVARTVGPAIGALTTIIYTQTAASLAARSAALQMGVAVQAYSASAIAASAASRALTASLALVGGPAGLALLAGAGIYYLATRETEAEKETRALRDRIAELSSGLIQLNDAAVRLQLDGVRDQLRQVNEEIAKTEQRLSDAMAGVGGSGTGRNSQFLGTAGVEARLTDDTEALTAKRRELLQLEQVLAGQLNRTTEEVKKQADAVVDLDVETKATADDLKKLAQEAEKLRDALYPGKAALDDLNEALNTLRRTGGDDAELARFVDIWAESLAPIDAATQAVRDYEMQIGLLEVALEEGLISQERFDEVAGRLRKTLEGSGEAVKMAAEPFQDLRDVIVATGEDWARSASAIVQGLENISKGTKTSTLGWAQLTQGAAGFFKEGTGGYKALQAASQAFYAFEIASQLQSTVAAITASQVKQTESAKQAVAGGTANVAGSGQGLAFPYNLIAMGLTIAALASLGVSVGSGGSQVSGALDVPRSGGLDRGGTVLGDPDAASESIVNSVERLREIADTGLSVNRQMLAALTNIEQALNAASSVFAQFAQGQGRQSVVVGGTAGGIEIGTEQVGAITSAEFLAGDFDAQIAELLRNASGFVLRLYPVIQQTFDQMGVALGEAVSSLGGDGLAAIDAFRALDLGEIVIEEGEDIGEAIQALFATVGDATFGIVADLMGINLAQFQQLGEGVAETLIRLAAEMDVLRDASGALGLSIATTVENADALALASGGIEQLADNLSVFYDVVLTDSEKLARARANLTDLFGSLGLALPQTREALRDLVEGVTDPQALAAIFGASDALGDFFDTLEDRAQALADFNTDISTQIARFGLSGQSLDLFDLDQEFADLRRQAEEVGASLVDVERLYGMRRADIVRRYAEEAAEAQRRAAEEAARAAEQAAAEAKRAYEQMIAGLRQAVSDAERDVVDAYNAESERLRQIIEAEAAAQQRVGAARQAAIAAYDREIDALQSVADAAEAAASRLQTAESALQAAYNAEAAPLNERINQFEQLGDAIRGFIDGLAADITGMGNAGVRFADIARRARLGDVDALAALPQAGQDAAAQLRSTAGSREDLLRGLAGIRRDAKAAESVADAQKSIAQQQLDQLTEQVTALGVLNESVLSVADAIADLLQARDAVTLANRDATNAQTQIAWLTKARDAIADVDGSTLSVDQAVRALATAQLDLQIAQQQAGAAQQQLNAITAQLNALGLLNNSTLTLKQAIDSLKAAQTALLNATNAGITYVGTQTGATASNTANLLSASLQALNSQAQTIQALTRLPDRLGGISQIQANAIVDAIAVGAGYSYANGLFINDLTGQVFRIGQQQHDDALTAIYAQYSAIQTVAGLPAQLGGISQGQANQIIGAIADGYGYDYNNGLLISQTTGAVYDLQALQASIGSQQLAAAYEYDRSIKAIDASLYDLELAFFAASNHEGINTGQWTSFTYRSLEYWFPRLLSELQAIHSNTAAYNSSQGINAYAHGGVFSNGPRYFDNSVLGEDGPEAIMPLTRMSNGALGVMAQASNDGSAMVAELRALRAEVAQLRNEQRSSQYAIAKNTMKTADVLEKFDDDGMPEVRAA